MSDERRPTFPEFLASFPLRGYDPRDYDGPTRELRRQLTGEFEAARPSLAVRMWAAYYLTTDLFDGTPGQVPEYAREASTRFAVAARRFFAEQIGPVDERDARSARDEGQRLAEEIQRHGWRP